MAKKATQQVVERIVSMYNEGRTNSEIAEAVGLGYSTVGSYIAANRHRLNRKARGGRISTSMPRQALDSAYSPMSKKSVASVVAKTAAKPVAKFLKLVGATQEFKGEVGDYLLDSSKREIVISVGDCFMCVGFSEICKLASEIDEVRQACALMAIESMEEVKRDVSAENL